MVMLPADHLAEAERLTRLAAETGDAVRRVGYLQLAHSHRARAAVVEATLRKHRVIVGD
jgi:hypothetical protein